MAFLDALLGGLKGVASASTPLPPEPTVNFTGSGVTVTDDPTNGQTTVNIPGGAASSRIYVLPQTYGAVGNGSTDDSTAFATMIAANAGKDILVGDGVFHLANNVSFNANQNIYFQNGAVLNIASGKTLTIAKPNVGLTQQVFSGAGTVTLPANTIASPMWWGAKGDGATDDAPAFAQAIASGANLEIPAGTYKLNSNTTFDSTKEVKFHAGAVLDRGSTVFVNVNSHIVSPIGSQIFTPGYTIAAGSQTAGFAVGLANANRIHPYWWGAKGDNSNDDTSAILSACVAARTAWVNTSAPGGALESAPTVYFVTGIYKTTSTLEFHQFIGIDSDDGAVINCASSSVVAVRIAAYYNIIGKLVIIGGLNGLALYGPSAVFGGGLGTPTASSVVRIKDLTVRYQSGPSIYQDTSQSGQNRTASIALIIDKIDFQGAAMYWATCDSAVIGEAWCFYDVSTVPVLKGDGKPAALVTSADKVYIENLVVVPNGIVSDRAALFEGDGVCGMYNVRFGGEGVAVGARFRRSGLTWNGVAPPFVTGNRGTLNVESCEMTSCAGTNWLEIYDVFPDYISVRDVVPTPDGSGGSVGIFQSNGVWVDSGVDSEFLARDTTGLIIDLDGNPFAYAFRFRQSSDYSTTVGTDLTEQLRRFWLKPLKFYDANDSSGRENLFFTTIVSSEVLTTGTATNIGTDATDSGTGYTLTRKIATAADASYSVGTTTSTFTTGWGSGVAAGTYTFAFYLQTSFSGTMYFIQDGKSIGYTDICNTDGLYKRFEIPFYHTGTATVLGFEIFHIPNGGTFTSGLYAIYKGPKAPPVYTFPTNSPTSPTTNVTDEKYIRSTYLGTAIPSGGTYKVGDTIFNTTPAQGDPAGWVCKVAGTPGTWEPFGGAINLAGGSHFVTGSLPAGNQADQTMGGDVTGTTGSAAVVGLTGTASVIAMHGNILRADSGQDIIVEKNDGSHILWFDIPNDRMLLGRPLAGDYSQSDPGRVVGGNIDVGGNTDVTLINTQFYLQIIQLTGTLTGNINVIFPTTSSGFYIKTVRNATSGAFTLTIKANGGSNTIVVPAGQVLHFYCDGSEVWKISLV